MRLSLLVLRDRLDVGMPIPKSMAREVRKVPVTPLDVMYDKIDERIIASFGTEKPDKPIELPLTESDLRDPDLVAQTKATYSDAGHGWTCEIVLRLT